MWSLLKEKNFKKKETSEGTNHRPTAHTKGTS
jgi:hypothetical protein